MIVTPNPEFAVRAARDERFAGLLKSADLAVCDGFGLALAGRLWGVKVPEVVTGVSLAVGLAWLCESEGRKLYLLGGEYPTAAEKSASYLKSNFPKLIIAGAEPGGLIRRDGEVWDQDPGLIDRINDAAPDVLFVALGHGKQEDWIRSHLAQLPSVRVAIGIGGAFNYWSGHLRRPPSLVRRFHLEWLWRLVTEPRVRARRIYDAVIRFPILALKKRLQPVK
jgi:N-acetylglucosaminyldiphosphoundecaprenol N-acetyl-beta-D-mannosaminyltransferase